MVVLGMSKNMSHLTTPDGVPVALGCKGLFAGDAELDPAATHIVIIDGLSRAPMEVKREGCIIHHTLDGVVVPTATKPLKLTSGVPQS